MKIKIRGRPTELTPEIQGKICAAIQIGVYLEAAAPLAGINRTTLWRWLERGKQEPGIYRDFCNAVEEARSQKILRYVTPMAQAVKGPDPDWRAGAWMLERTEPEHYGPRVKIEQNEPPEKPKYHPKKKTAP